MSIQDKTASGELAVNTNLSTIDNGAQGNYITEYADLAGGNMATPEQLERAQRVSADTIAALLKEAASFEGDAKTEALKAINQLAGKVPEAERGEISSALYRYKIVVTGKEEEAWIRSIPSEPKQFKFKPLSLADVFALPDQQWLVEGVIAKGDLGMVFGAPGSGKTFALIDLLFAALQGKQWAGFADIPEPLTVAYAAGEGAGGLKARFMAAAAAHEVGPDQANGLHVFLDVPQIYTPKGRYGEPEAQPNSAQIFAEQYKEILGLRKLDLLVLDTLHSAAVGSEENSARDTGEIIKNARMLCNELGCAVILVHHSNKNGTAERGSSAFRGDLDFMIGVKEERASRKIECEKTKNQSPWKPQQFSLVSKGESVYCFWDGEAAEDDGPKSEVPAKLLRVLGEDSERWLTAKQLSDAIGESPSLANKWLSKLEQAGKLKREQRKADSGKMAWHYKSLDIALRSSDQ